MGTKVDSDISVVAGDFTDVRVLSLLKEHLDGMHDTSPPGSVYALGAAALQAPEVAFFTAWRDGQLLGCAALKHLDESRGELKSMRTTASQLRQGVGSRLLEHLLALARARGYRQVLLETGSGPAFEPALGLYRRYGFESCEAFGDYQSSDFNRFLRLELA